MIERIKEIIAFLMDPDRPEAAGQMDIQDTLADMGYSNEEIYHALNMMNFDSDVEDQLLLSDILPGVRVLSESEKSVLSLDAQGHLLMLLRLGWLNEIQFNLIIETAAMEYSPPVSIDEIREMSRRFVADLPDNPQPDHYKRNDESH